MSCFVFVLQCKGECYESDSQPLGSNTSRVIDGLLREEY